MALSIRQDEQYRGHDYWHWSVWLDGSPEELNDVDHVMWILHHTTLNPVREVSDRSSNFRLEDSSWGIFTVRAKVFHKSGQETVLHHDLVLTYPDGTPTTA
jgi:transcription initiation factor IIF auxiliary subunit